MCVGLVIKLGRLGLVWFTKGNEKGVSWFVMGFYLVVCLGVIVKAKGYKCECVEW